MLEELIILSALILGSITDLKKREVPDTLNFSLIAIGLFINLALSIVHFDYLFILNSFAGFGAGFLIGALFYYTGQWGGGDAKLVMGVGAVMGLNPFLIFSSMSPFFLFIITSLFVGAIYGVFWLFFLAFKNFKSFKQEYLSLRKASKYSKYRWIILVFAIVLLALFAFGVDLLIIGFAYIFLVLIALAIYSKDFMKAVENSALIKKVKISNLVEGDWVIDSFDFKEKNIDVSKTGISSDDILFLKEKGVKNVAVREGIPFVPSFLLAYVLLLFVGNWFLLL